MKVTPMFEEVEPSNAGFIAPMLASPYRDTFTPKKGEWTAEEKYDGIRLVAFNNEKGQVTTWSRYGKLHPMPAHITDLLSQLPKGSVYDGEAFVPGLRSYGTLTHAHRLKMVFVVFDVMHLLGTSTLDITQAHRRRLLEEIGPKHKWFLDPTSKVHLAQSTLIQGIDDVLRLRDLVWARDGEGLILKKQSVVYRPGKRPKEWMKVKKLQSAILTLIGFKPGTGSIIDTGPFAIALLRDEEGNETKVKVLDDATRAHLQAVGSGRTRHPYIGRKLRIEFQERTPDGSYRHPRWDRWEDQ